MPIKRVMTKGKVPVKIYTDDIEQDALRQLYNISQLPIIHRHVAAMPDVHLGKGATVGSVIPTRGAIIPAAVGVDIGCGMNAVRLSVGANRLPDDLGVLRSAIEAEVPVGFAQHKTESANALSLQRLGRGLERIVAGHPKITSRQKNPHQTWMRQLGTLGGGNHFIELCLDHNDDLWVMLHSGSRGIGNVIGRYFIELAKRDMHRHISRLPDRDLAYFTEGAEHFRDYVEAVNWAQDYALTNRREMMALVMSVLRKHLPAFELVGEAIDCHHNYVAVEEHFGESVYVTRKGAIRAGEGDLGIIPGSMGARSYIVRGKGNRQAFLSCAHGAGRRMSRSAARRSFTRKDLEMQTSGIECRKDKGVIDEIPGAYKDIDEVMANQADLVDVVYTLRQLVCIKG
jgi:tRNA-splicing ligase RtcB